MNKVNSYKLIFVMVVLIILLGFQTISAQNVTLNFASWQFLEPGRAEKLEELINNFEGAHENINVNIVKIPFGSYVEKLITEFEAKSGPDVFHIQGYAMQSWKERDLLAPLDDFIDVNELDEKLINFYQATKKEGRAYAFPYESFCYAGLITNKYYLDEVGLDIPKTTDELIELSERIEAETDALYGLIFMINPAEPTYLAGGGLNRIIFGFGAEVADDNGNFTVNDPKFIEAVKFMKKLYDSPGTPQGVPMGDQRAAFNAGKAGMTVDGSYYMAIVERENLELYENGIIVAPLPFPTKNTMAEVNYFGVNKNYSKEKQEAIKLFLEYFLEEENQKAFSLTGKVLTGITSANQEIANSIPWFKPYADALPYSVDPVIKGHEAQTPEIRSLLADYIGQILVGKLAVEDGLNTLQIELEKNFN